MNSLSDRNPDGIPSCDTMPMAISKYTEASSEAIPDFYPELTHQSTHFPDGWFRQLI
jgi:hypothetical protein